MPTEIKDRQTISDHVADWMHDNCPSWSIDTLLTHPETALKMARSVCRRMHQKPTDGAVNEVCRAALASRKRGDLKRDKH